MATLFRSTDAARRQGYSPMKLVVWMVALLLFAAPYAKADTYPIVVDANVGHVNGPLPCVTLFSAAYATIGAAVSAAPAGATILVCPGTYPEQITISKSLTLLGVTNTAANTGAAVIAVPPPLASGPGLLVSNGFPFAVQVVVQASNVNIVDVTVDGSGAFTSCSSPGLVGVGFDTGSSGTLRRVAIRNQNIPDGSGGYCGIGYGIFSQTNGSVTVQDSSVRGFASNGFASSSAIFDATAGFSPTSIVIKTTVFVPINGASAESCVFAGAVTIQFSNNTVTNCGVGLELVRPQAFTITGNTITNTGAGITCRSSTCSGGNVSNNTIAGVTYGVSEFLGPAYFSGTTFQYNDISGAVIGLSLSGAGNTVRYNTINDAQYGIVGVTGNNVSHNTFLNVTTLTQ